ncbi:hypothetical protein ACLOJK_038347 [Asimina triloba]
MRRRGGRGYEAGSIVTAAVDGAIGAGAADVMTFIATIVDVVIVVATSSTKAVDSIGEEGIVEVAKTVSPSFSFNY